MTSYHSNIDRLRREIADLMKSDASEAKKRPIFLRAQTAPERMQIGQRPFPP